MKIYYEYRSKISIELLYMATHDYSRYNERRYFSPIDPHHAKNQRINQRARNQGTLKPMQDIL